MSKFNSKTIIKSIRNMLNWCVFTFYEINWTRKNKQTKNTKNRRDCCLSWLVADAHFKQTAVWYIFKRKLSIIVGVQIKALNPWQFSVVFLGNTILICIYQKGERIFSHHTLFWYFNFLYFIFRAHFIANHAKETFLQVQH